MMPCQEMEQPNGAGQRLPTPLSLYKWLKAAYGNDAGN